MMLATNKPIRLKEDVIAVAKHYFSRWKIEEYFRSKKQLFQFENFRVRKLSAINALNFYITLCMAFLAHISMKPETNALKVAIIQTADSIKEKVYFCYYRLPLEHIPSLAISPIQIRILQFCKKTVSQIDGLNPTDLL